MNENNEQYDAMEAGRLRELRHDLDKREAGRVAYFSADFEEGL